MRLHTDAEVENMSRQGLTSVLNLAQVVYDANTDDNTLREFLRQFERTRTIGIWHDHSTLLGKGYVMITAKVMYDTAVFKTKQELEGASLVENM